MKRIIFLTVFILAVANSYSQRDTIDVVYDISRKVPLFENDDSIEFTLRFDITTFRKERSEDEELSGILTYHFSDGDSVNKEIQIKARGNMRKSYCDMPPIRLNFRKSEESSDEFSNIDKVKLVTHCKFGNSESILREYLVYKMYSVFTDFSFKVRLARITYINTARESKPIKEYGFLIEPVELLSERLGIVEVKPPKLNQTVIRPAMMDRMAIFNYMIGNTDWSVPIMHNVAVFASRDSTNDNRLLIIPYDFDQAGLVGAPYAAPFEGLGLESVKERLYLGVCRTIEEFTVSLSPFPGKKVELMKIVSEFPLLNERQKKDMTQYLEGFFKGFDKRNTNLYKLHGDCIELK